MKRKTKLIIGRVDIELRFTGFFLLLLITTFNRINHFDAPRTTQYRSVICGIILIYILITTTKSIYKRILFILPYLFVIFISGCKNYGFNANLLNSIITIMVIYETFVLVEKYIQEYGINKFINLIFRFLLIFICIVDISVFKARNSSVGGLDSTLYFSGDKFSVAYLHLIFLGVLGIKYNWKTSNRKTGIFVFLMTWIYSFIICMKINCGTGKVGLLVFLLVSILNKQVIKKLANPWVYIINLIVLSCTYVFSSFFMNFEIVKNFIVNFLGKDLSMTGRIGIYSGLMPILKNSLLLGYGNATRIVAEVIGYGNAQNGILHIIIQFGVIGAVALLYIIYKAFSSLNQNDKIYATSLIAFLYAMLSCSLAEICLDYNFLFGIAIIYSIGKNKIKKNDI